LHPVGSVFEWLGDWGAKYTAVPLCSIWLPPALVGRALCPATPSQGLLSFPHHFIAGVAGGGGVGALDWSSGADATMSMENIGEQVYV